MRKLYFSAIFATLLLLACTPQPSRVPMYLSVPQDRLAYLLDHYWDSIHPADSASYTDAQLSVLYEDYLGLVCSLPIESATSKLFVPLEKYQGRLLFAGLDSYRKYLYDRSSPLYSKELYIQVLKWYIGNPKVPAEMQDGAQEELLSLLSASSDSIPVDTLRQDSTFVLSLSQDEFSIPKDSFLLRNTVVGHE